MIQLTVNEPVSKVFTSSYGDLTYYDWCLAEIGRLKKDGIKAEMRISLDGESCSLWREKIDYENSN